MKSLNALCIGGPESGRNRMLLDQAIQDGGTCYEAGAVGWYGCVRNIDGEWLRDKKGRLVLFWCGWLGEGVE